MLHVTRNSISKRFNPNATSSSGYKSSIPGLCPLLLLPRKWSRLRFRLTSVHLGYFLDPLNPPVPIHTRSSIFSNFPLRRYLALLFFSSAASLDSTFERKFILKKSESLQEKFSFFLYNGLKPPKKRAPEMNEIDLDLVENDW